MSTEVPPTASQGRTATADAGDVASVGATTVLLAGVCAAMYVGKLPPALPALQADLGLSLPQAGFMLSLVQLAGMLLGLTVGLAADGLGLKRSLLGGLLLLSCAGLLGIWVDSTAALLVLRAVEGLGFLLVAMPGPGLIRQLVAPGRLNSMMGLWGAYMPLGTALALLCGPLWIAQPYAWGGWRGWWGGLAAVTLGMAWLAWRQIPSDQVRAAKARGTVLGPAPQALPKVAAAAWPARLRQTLASRSPWLVALCFAMYSGQWLAVVGFLPSIYAQAGLSAGLTGVLTALAAGVNIGGNVCSGRLLQRGWGPGRLLAIGFVSMALGALLTFADFGSGFALPPSVRYLAVLVFSGVGGLIPGTLFSLAVRLAPSEGTVSTTVGWMQQLSALGQFCGPPIVAWLAQRVGGWHWTWAVTGLCALLGLGLSAPLARLAALRR